MNTLAFAAYFLSSVFRFWVVCADMAAQYTVPDPGHPGKMFMDYQGLASYLSSGGKPAHHVLFVTLSFLRGAGTNFSFLTSR